MANRRANVSFQVVANGNATANNPAVLMHYAVPDGVGTAIISSTWLLLNELLEFAGIITKEADPVATKAVEDLKGIVDALPSSTTIEPIKTSITELTDKYAGLKTNDETVNAAIKALQENLANLPASGATQEQIDEINAKIKAASDAVKAIENGKTLYTTTATVQAGNGDTVCILGEGDIQLEGGPVDGAEVRVLDPLKLIKAGKNNVIPGTGDFIGQGQGIVTIGDTSPLSFDDNSLLGGILTLRYRAAVKSWDVFVSTATAAQSNPDSMLGVIEETRAPTIEDLDKPWAIWFEYRWDMPNLRATIHKYERTPNSNDILPSPKAWELKVTLTPVANGPKFDLDLPQEVKFSYTPQRSAQLNQASFPEGVLSAIGYEYLDSNGGAIRTGAAGHQVSADSTDAGLGIVDAPANAVSVRFTFVYHFGGKLTYIYPLPQP